MKHFVWGLYLISTFAYSYVKSKTETGNDIKWSSSSSSINIYVNPVVSGYDTTTVQSILATSISDWNTYSSYTLNPVYTTTIPTNADASIQFTTDSDWGSGVVGVTEKTSNIVTGNILSAHIKIFSSNYSTTLSTDPTQSSGSYAYIGDVVTHEIGHLFGLTHSEHIGASMYFAVTKGQSSLHTDDIAGLRDIYNITSTSGSLSGRVIVANSLPVFAARVTAISTVTGEAIQSQLTGEDGTFSFENLSLNDSYYIMVSPYRLVDNIVGYGEYASEYYSTIKSNFCNFENFKPTFYTKCGPRSKSIPQSFYLDSDTDSIAVGDITVRCDENLNVEYYSKKFETSDREFELNPDGESASVIFNGIFSDSEVTLGNAGQGDEYSLDLSNIDTGSNSPSSYSLRLNFLSTGINSNMDFEVQVKRSDVSGYTTYQSSTDSTGKTITDLEIDLALSSTASNNIYSIIVYPTSLSSTEEQEIFSSATDLINDSNIYVFTAQVGTISGDSFTPLEPLDSYPYEDNSLCSEGEANYTVAANKTLSSTLNNAEQLPLDDDIQGVSCGTIDIDNDSNSSGMMSFVLGLFLILLLNSLSKFNPFERIR